VTGGTDEADVTNVTYVMDGTSSDLSSAAEARRDEALRNPWERPPKGERSATAQEIVPPTSLDNDFAGDRRDHLNIRFLR